MNIYPHANTVVCIEDSRLLKRFEYGILYDTKDLQSALGRLNEMNYFRTYRSADDDNYSALLDGLTGETLKFIRDITPDPVIHRMFALYYDIHNIKLAAKERLLHQRFDGFYMDHGYYTQPTLRSATVREADDILNDATLTAGLFEALRTRDAYEADFVLDKAYLKALKAAATALDNEMISAFITVKIDLYNISAYFQSIAAGCPDGYFARTFSDQGSFTFDDWQDLLNAASTADFFKSKIYRQYAGLFDEEEKHDHYENLDVHIDNYLIDKTKICKIMAFGIEPIAAYFFNKFMEIKNIRILLTGKEHGYDTRAIVTRMRIPYEL